MTSCRQSRRDEERPDGDSFGADYRPVDVKCRGVVRAMSKSIANAIGDGYSEVRMCSPGK